MRNLLQRGSTNVSRRLMQHWLSYLMQTMIHKRSKMQTKTCNRFKMPPMAWSRATVPAARRTPSKSSIMLTPLATKRPSNINHLRRAQRQISHVMRALSKISHLVDSDWVAVLVALLRMHVFSIGRGRHQGGVISIHSLCMVDSIGG